MKELYEIIGDLVADAERCVDDGNCWVRASDFSEVADKLIKINETIPRWFSVSDKLPDHLQDVLVSGSIIDIDRYNANLSRFESWESGGFESGEWVEDVGVKLWMPIPKLPEPL